MGTPDFFHSRLDAMIDHRHPLMVLAARLTGKLLALQPIVQVG